MKIQNSRDDPINHSEHVVKEKVEENTLYCIKTNYYKAWD